jgi:hypothetical protein
MEVRRKFLLIGTAGYLREGGNGRHKHCCRQQNVAHGMFLERNSIPAKRRREREELGAAHVTGETSRFHSLTFPTRVLSLITTVTLKA